MLADTLNRPLRNLRLSVTDRCNLRCSYCMPEDEYVWLPREDLLRFEEISRLVDLFFVHGVDRIRLTGGEPLLRRDLTSLVQMLAVKRGLRDLALTTNGVLLADQAEALKAAGLHRVTVSLDTLRRDTFIALARTDDLERVKAGIETARKVFPHQLKLDTVVIKGVNDSEIAELIEYGKTVGAEVRFIEYMDVGGATLWSFDRVVSRDEILRQLVERYGKVEPIVEDSSAPADRYTLPDGTVFGIISSTTAPFCASCDRSRLTADGMWYLCLYATRGLDLRQALRTGASDEALLEMIATGWRARLALRDRRAFVPLNALKRDPHLEMHTRGG